MSNLFKALNRFQLFDIMANNPALRKAAHEELKSRPFYFVTRDEVN